MYQLSICCLNFKSTLHCSAFDMEHSFFPSLHNIEFCCWGHWKILGEEQAFLLVLSVLCLNSAVYDHWEQQGNGPALISPWPAFLSIPGDSFPLGHPCGQFSSELRSREFLCGQPYPVLKRVASQLTTSTEGFAVSPELQHLLVKSSSSEFHQQWVSTTRDYCSTLSNKVGSLPRRGPSVFLSFLGAVP